MPEPDLTERVLLVVASIPPGRVASYGDVGAVVGVGPRFVGRVLALHGTTLAGEPVPWWRVMRRDGSLEPVLLPEARKRWAAEGIHAGSGRDRMGQCRADPHQLAADYEAALGQWRTS